MKTKRAFRFSARGARRMSGLSLLEVIIATAVLAASAAVIAEMVGVAVQHASHVTELTEAHMHCHNIMNELVAGIRPWESVASAQAIDPWTPWEYEVKIEPLGFANLAALTVTVMPRPDSSSAAVAGGTGSGGGVAMSSAASSDRSSSQSSDAGGMTLTGQDGRRRYRWTRWVRQDISSSDEKAPSGLPASDGNERQQSTENRP